MIAPEYKVDIISNEELKTAPGILAKRTRGKAGNSKVQTTPAVKKRDIKKYQKDMPLIVEAP
jgi:hypothetical protein